MRFQTPLRRFILSPNQLGNRKQWFDKHTGKYTVIVAVENDVVLGWASLSSWSDRCAYSNTADVAVYIKKGFRGKGIGKKLVKELIEKGSKNGLHTAIAKICSENEVSLNMFGKLGFKHIGTMKEVGFKSANC